MTRDDLIKEFLSNGGKLEVYREAMRLLRSTNVEDILRRCGEPIDFALENPRHLELSAFDHAERRGWYRALDALFNFEDVFEGTGAEVQHNADFGVLE